MKDFVSRLKINAVIAVYIVFIVECVTLAWWWHTVPSSVMASIDILSVAMLTVLITAVREIHEAHEREFYRRLKHGLCTHKVKIKYDSRGMHTDGQRLGYVSAETIREVCTKGAKQ